MQYHKEKWLLSKYFWWQIKFMISSAYMTWPDSSVGWSVWTEFRGRGFKCHSGQLFIATSKNLSVVNTICTSSFRYTRDYLQKTSIKINVATDEGKQLKWNVTLNKRWNWSSFTKLTLSASWTHGLIALSVRASAWNSVAVGSNSTQTNFL